MREEWEGRDRERTGRGLRERGRKKHAATRCNRLETHCNSHIDDLAARVWRLELSAAV